MKKVRVAVVDDHEVVCIGLKYTIGVFKDLEFVGSHHDGEGAAAFVREVQSDVTLLDIRMPTKDGLVALEEILASDPAAKVIMLSTVGTEEDVYRALELGAKGYVLKDDRTENLIEAIRTVAHGGEYVPEAIRRIYAARQLRQPLTPRERQTLDLLSVGSSNREIAEEMGISEDAVKNHFRRINEKLGTKDRVEALSVALRRGLVRTG